MKATEAQRFMSQDLDFLMDLSLKKWMCETENKKYVEVSVTRGDAGDQLNFDSECSAQRTRCRSWQWMYKLPVSSLIPLKLNFSFW